MSSFYCRLGKKLQLLRRKYIRQHMVGCVANLNNASYSNNNFENILESNKKVFSSFENYLDYTFPVTARDVLPTRKQALFLLLCIWALHWCIQRRRDSKLLGAFALSNVFLLLGFVACQTCHTLGRYKATFLETVSWRWLILLEVSVTWQYRSNNCIVVN